MLAKVSHLSESFHLHLYAILPTYPRNSYDYFQMAQNRVHPTQCRDLTTLQAIVIVITYLQAPGRLSHCHLYLALASASTAQLGFHQSDTPTCFDFVQAETSRRVYWTLVTMDIYLSNILGLASSGILARSSRLTSRVLFCFLSQESV